MCFYKFQMRALGIVLDSVGCGNATDAEMYGDLGADTLGKLMIREGLQLPHMASLGLYEVLRQWNDQIPQSPMILSGSAASYMAEASAGKDTTTGHWEIAGVITSEPFATFPTFPAELIAEIEHRAQVRFMGNVIASGTEVIERFGVQHVADGTPILYTSVDSVMQIAAHEEAFGLERLYDVCRAAREVIDEKKLRIGRVIARPFRGGQGEPFERTASRRDFSLMPPRLVMQDLQERGVKVIGVGKISDIFCDQGISESHPTKSNEEGMKCMERLWRENQSEPCFIFANLVDFDMLFGHRRDAVGYANALRKFDEWLGGFLGQVREDDFVFITADHGNDPYHHGTDHTRELVPLLARNAPALLCAGANFTQIADLLRLHFPAIR
jgi:phosphopentomutase